MNPLGRAMLAVDMPEFARKLLLRRLFSDTAVAFGRPAPALGGLSAEELLQDFRAFTAQAGAAQVSARLYAIANGYGRSLRGPFGIASMEDTIAVARWVYRMIGIDFGGTPDGEITITRCYFSTKYTPEVCRVMSALDAGLLAGLSGGRQLQFSQRITEGYPCCVARVGVL